MDSLQNARGKLLAAVYSARAYPNAPVSTPVTVDELQGEFSADHWDINNIEKRLKKVGDPWVSCWSKRQSLSKALDLLERQISR